MTWPRVGWGKRRGDRQAWICSALGSICLHKGSAFAEKSGSFYMEPLLNHSNVQRCLIWHSFAASVVSLYVWSQCDWCAQLPEVKGHYGNTLIWLRFIHFIVLSTLRLHNLNSRGWLGLLGNKSNKRALTSICNAKLYPIINIPNVYLWCAGGHYSAIHQLGNN